jgi:dihydroneopterin aldolase
MIVHLNNLRFFAYHGLFPEERKTGNQFIVNVSVDYPDEKIITGLEATINYADLFNLIKLEMEKPRDLMETLAMEITETIHQSWKYARKIDITITKQQPPITGFSGSAGVTFSRSYS